MIFVLKGTWAVPVIFSILILGTLGLSQDAFGTAFVKYDGIDGEAADKDHADWSDLSGVVSFDSFFDITYKMSIDKSSPKLYEAFCKGVASDPGVGILCSGVTITTPPDSGGDVPVDPLFSSVTIDMCRLLSGAKQVCYLQFELEDVRITSYSMSGSTQGEDVPVMEVSLNFEKIKVTYTEFDPKGAKKGNVEYSWKVEEGTS